MFSAVDSKADFKFLAAMALLARRLLFQPLRLHVAAPLLLGAGKPRPTIRCLSQAPSRRPLRKEELESYRRDGFVILKNVYNKDEIDLLRETVLEDDMLRHNVMDMVDSNGKVSRLSLWRHAGDDTYGMFSRGQRMVSFAKAATESDDDSIYHFHTKVMLKEPQVGGRWEWHQDFGYWYEVGCLQPEKMLSIMVAIDEATVENGCLEVLRGSHKLGRLQHGHTGEQVGAEPWALEQATGLMETVPCQMGTGDVLMLHSNTLHKSNANLSDRWRRVMIVAFTTKDNQPKPNTIAPLYSAMHTVDDSAILELGKVGRAANTTADFLKHDDNVDQYKLEEEKEKLK